MAGAIRSPVSTPGVRMTTSAIRPSVSSGSMRLASSIEFAVWVAPIFLAFSSLKGTRSTAMIWRAPARRAPCRAPEPTPPHPTTTTVSPGRTLARSTAEPNPVEMPQLIRAAALSDASGSIFTSDASLTTMWSANVPSWVIRLTLASPRWCRQVMSLIIGPARVNMPRSHRCWRPEAHQKQVPQAGMKAAATWSPTATVSTPSPTSTTTPAPSWPPMHGKSESTPKTDRISGSTLMSPLRRCSSEWHIPA